MNKINILKSEAFKIHGLTYLFFIPLAFILLFASCSDDDKEDPASAAQFSGMIRGTTNLNNTWPENAQIGIFMVKTGQTLSAANIVDQADNVKYVSAGDGENIPFNAADQSQAIYLPKDKSLVDFISYYPYQQLSNYNYAIDITDQSNPDNIDLLYSSNVKAANNSSPAVRMQFYHMFSKIIIDVTSGNGVTAGQLSSIDVKINGTNVKGTFNLANAKLEYAANQIASISPKKVADLKYEAIVLPTLGSVGERSLTFTVPELGEFTGSIDDATLFEEGKVYKYPVTINFNSISIGQPEIVDWEDDGDEGGDASYPDSYFLSQPNSYIVAPGVSLSIPVGKAYEIWEMDPILKTFNEDMSGTATVELLWQDVKSLISAANLTLTGEGKNAKINIKSNPDIKNGNAVVVLKINGTVYWSWHVWITDYNPDLPAGQKTNNGFTFMDRNLGAYPLSDTESSTIGRTTGMYYQWGRKDAMPSAGGYMSGSRAIVYNIDNNNNALKTDMSLSEDAKDNLSKSIKNPHNFIKSTASDWYSLNNEAGANRWNNTNGTKTVFDPCPKGWRVPVGGEGDKSPWYGVTIPEGETFEKGITFTNLGFYPASGYYQSTNTFVPAGTMGSAGFNWTATPSSSQTGRAYHFKFNSTTVGISEVIGAANAMPVRCVKE